jgi:2-oxoglutarate dehydrogenase E1 component
LYKNTLDFFLLNTVSRKIMSWISPFNIDYIEEQYKCYLKAPHEVEGSWRNFFDGLRFPDQTRTINFLDFKVYKLLQAYRSYGHLKAAINPLLEKSGDIKELDFKNFGFTTDDLTKRFSTKTFLKKNTATLQEIIDILEKIYCSSMGIEYNHIRDKELRDFIQKVVEQEKRPLLTSNEKLSILQNLIKAQLLESFLQTKFVGQKRFSLEGGESFIPLLSFIIENAAAVNLDEVVIGMAHRGRINVLANIVQEPYENIFKWFRGDDSVENINEKSGDVKYHRGASRTIITRNGKQITVRLLHNPSHLELVNPVVEGVVRAAQQKGKRVLPIIVHGDASMAGQGIVYETLQLSKLYGYKTGGTFHIVINNQIGFTTNPKDDRSTDYCTAIALPFQAPIFHVNAEKPEVCIHAAHICFKILQKFQSSVFIDLTCYRKYGHNESDEPTFTQPLEYQIIQNKKSIYSLYREQLFDENILNEETSNSLEKKILFTLQSSFDKNITIVNHLLNEIEKDPFEVCKTAIPNAILIELIKKLSLIPKQFNLHPKIKRLLDNRLKVIKTDGAKLDWATAEQLAIASILSQGVSVRITGQDVERGTFSQRHAVWVDQKTGEKYSPFEEIDQKGGYFNIFNSPLSELAALGFEFGYSLEASNTLCLWEAQYGDFVNSAQTIIDQYIACSEEKWGVSSKLTLFLPHGVEGEGPEHSSARIERFLQLSANLNWQLISCSTPAQLFHILRRQAVKKTSTPLILFTPKKLLRHPLCVSPISDFSSGQFYNIIDDRVETPSLILLCSGKIYYDLIANKKKETIAIIRIEQLYPFCAKEFLPLVQKYSTTERWRWVQEEPSNAGAKNYIGPILEQIIGKRLEYVSLPPSSSTAPGFSSLYKKQFNQLIKEAFQ